MADGLNETRAIRVIEIVSDYRNLQNYLAQIQATPTADEYYLEGYALLRQCAAEAQALLSTPFGAATTSPGDNPERQKAQLRTVILDSSVRRFQCQRIYLRTHAGLRWMNSRNGILRGQKAHAGHFPALQAVDNTLRVEIASITDEHVDYTLRSQDATQGKWLAEDPALGTIQQILAARQ